MSGKRAVAVSKTLSWLLRHGAEDAGLRMSPDGYVRLSEVLSYPKLSGVKVETVEEIVASCDKQRFALVDDETGERYIRANQGHTLTGLDDAALLAELREPSDAPTCIHGTYRRCIEPIITSGLSRMSRNHVHCAALLPEEGAVSGMRSTCQIAVYVDVAKAMALGLKWYRSANGVLLTPGDAAGLVPPSCFDKVIDLATGESIPLLPIKQQQQQVAAAAAAAGNRADADTDADAGDAVAERPLTPELTPRAAGGAAAAHADTDADQQGSAARSRKVHADADEGAEVAKRSRFRSVVISGGGGSNGGSEGAVGRLAVAGNPGKKGVRCEKRLFLSHLHIKTIILPRQARDRHRENSKKEAFFVGRGRRRQERQLW
jgi:2'-phosphotransferase